MRARTLLALLWGGVLAAAVAAPWLKAAGHPAAAAALYLLTAPVCHQNPDRSFACYGYGWALCHRCSGIYLGLCVGALWSSRLSGIWYAARLRRAWVVLGLTPLLLDATLPFVHIWVNTPATRVVSGLAFGLATGTLLVPALAELLARVPARVRVAAVPDTPGDFR